MKLTALAIKSAGGTAHIATAALDDGKTFTWTFHVGLFTAEKDLTEFARRAFDDVVAYCAAKIPPPLPSGQNAAGGAGA